MKKEPNYDFWQHYKNLMKDLDPSRNGYVTNQELEDTIKSIFPQKLKNVNLKCLFSEFASIQNKLLIDYKKFLKALQIAHKYRNISQINKSRKKEKTRSHSFTRDPGPNINITEF